MCKKKDGLVKAKQESVEVCERALPRSGEMKKKNVFECEMDFFLRKKKLL